MTGVCSNVKADLVRSLGAGAVTDYTREDFADGPGRYDVIVDTAGHGSLARLAAHAHVRGLAGDRRRRGGNRWTGGFGRQILRGPVLSLFVGQRLRPVMAEGAQLGPGRTPGLHRGGRRDTRSGPDLSASGGTRRDPVHAVRRGPRQVRHHHAGHLTAGAPRGARRVAPTVGVHRSQVARAGATRSPATRRIRRSTSIPHPSGAVALSRCPANSRSQALRRPCRSSS